MAAETIGMRTPEERAREIIDAKLAESGGILQSREEANVVAGPGVLIREFALTDGHGEADYLIFVDGRPVGALEAKPEGHTRVHRQLRISYIEPCGLQEVHVGAGDQRCGADRPSPGDELNTADRCQYDDII